MPFTYHPPTRQDCDVCQKFNGELKPIVETHRGKASAADNFPIHNWYNFVLGYTPEFPDYVLKREKVSSKNLVVDPFLGSGTTTRACKNLNRNYIGIEISPEYCKIAEDRLKQQILNF